MSIVFGMLALLSLGLALWQWVVARRFPLHQRGVPLPSPPALSLLKPLKGSDPDTARCLESWFTQDYAGEMELLFGVASPDDPVCEVVRGLICRYPGRQVQLVLCPQQLGPNAKVSTLIQLQERAQYDLTLVSDSDTLVPRDFLSQVTLPLAEPTVGLVNCFYSLGNPQSLAMQWEAVAVNGDFWSQVLQSKSMKPLDFALGAVMVTRRSALEQIGGFRSLVDYLADDYQLGHKVARHGHAIALARVVVECLEPLQGWSRVWSHQLRWTRTIRVCQPLPFFFSILSNATLWPLVWAALFPGTVSLVFLGLALVVRMGTAADNARRLMLTAPPLATLGMPLVKDLLQVALWAAAFLGNSVSWRGIHYRVLGGGRLERQ